MSSAKGMIYTIQNKNLKVKINSLGAELWSIQDKDGLEYLWQGAPEYWKDRGLQLFPYIGRLTGGMYCFQGMKYAMDIHGFLKDSEMDVSEKTETGIVFELSENADTIRQYPFRFQLKIGFRLEGNRIHIQYLVQNKDAQKMYFGIGGHPGFNVPLEGNRKFEDYYLEFAGNEYLEKIEMTEDCFVKGKTSMLPLEDGGRLRLHHELFDEDAVIVKRTFQKLYMGCGKGKHVEVMCPDMRYLGIWHAPKTDAPYICLEPWTSLPSRKGVTEDIAFQKDLIGLDAGRTYENKWEIKVGGGSDETDWERA